MNTRDCFFLLSGTSNDHCNHLYQPTRKYWQNILNGYSILLLIILYLLSWCVAKVPTQHHSKQGWATHVMVLLVLLPAPFLLVLETLLKGNPFLWLENWWIGISWTVFITPLAVVILFSPQVCYRAMIQYIGKIWC